MVATIDINKVNSVISLYKHTERTIEEGSDEHLDLILDVTNDLVLITAKTKELVDEIEGKFNMFTQETAEKAVISLFPIIRMAFQIMKTLERSFIYSSVKVHVDNFNIEVNDLKEFMSDLIRYKSQNNDDLIALFNDEN